MAMTNVDLMNIVCKVLADEQAVNNAIAASDMEATYDEVLEKAEARRKYLLKQRGKKNETSAQVQRRIIAKKISSQLENWVSPSEIATRFDLKSTNDASGLMRIALKNGYVEEQRDEKGKRPMYRAA